MLVNTSYKKKVVKKWTEIQVKVGFVNFPNVAICSAIPTLTQKSVVKIVEETKVSFCPSGICKWYTPPKSPKTVSFCKGAQNIYSPGQLPGQ